MFIWSNLLTASPVFQALTWIFQIMPLFFFAGVAASIDTWTSGTSWGNWLMRRCTRLYRPVFYYLAFWGGALAALRLVLPEHVYEPVAGISIQLLWFLGARLVLATVPLLARITTAGRLSPARRPTLGVVTLRSMSLLVLGLPEHGRIGDAAAGEHDAAVAATGRARNHDVRVRDCRRACDRALGAGGTPHARRGAHPPAGQGDGRGCGGWPSSATLAR